MSTILVVDDDKFVRGSLALLLGLRGHEVVTVADGVAAVAAVRERQPAHGLFDVRLERESGISVLRQTLKVAPKMHAALFTAWPVPAKDGNFLRRHGVGLIEKPATAGQLEEWIARRDAALSWAWWKDGIGPRRVLYVCHPSSPRELPAGLRITVATSTDVAYEELLRGHEFVVIDETLGNMQDLVSIAAETGRCVYVVTAAPEREARALEAGAVGSVAPDRLNELATVPLLRPKRRVALTEWTQCRLLDLATMPMPHDVRMALIDRLLLEDAIARHRSERRAAVSVGLSRRSFIRRLAERTRH